MTLIWTPSQLAVLAKVVDLNGFSAAARALGVPKAAVSRAVSDLERSLGVRLLERTTRRLALTAAGRLVIPHARQLLLEADAARAVVARLRAPAAGPLRVVADAGLGHVLLTPLVPRFLEAFPDIHLEVALDGSAAAGDWDVALRAAPAAEPGLGQRRLGELPAVLCATPAYLQARGVPMNPEELRGHDLLVPDTGAPEYPLRLERGAQRAEVALHPKLAVSDPAVLHAACAAGLGIALLPEFLCRQGLATGRLRPVLEAWRAPDAAALHAVFPVAMEADIRVQRFLEFLAANVVPALAGHARA